MKVKLCHIYPTWWLVSFVSEASLQLLLPVQLTFSRCTAGWTRTRSKVPFSWLSQLGLCGRWAIRGETYRDNHAHSHLQAMYCRLQQLTLWKAGAARRESTLAWGEQEDGKHEIISTYQEYENLSELSVVNEAVFPKRKTVQLILNGKHGKTKTEFPGGYWIKNVESLCFTV